MSERVVADLVPFIVDALREAGIVLRLDANQEKRCRRVLSLENVQNLRRPLRIGDALNLNARIRRTKAALATIYGAYGENRSFWPDRA